MVRKISPIDQKNNEYIHKSVFEYFVCQSAISEIERSRGNELDENTSGLAKAFLINDLDILR